VTSSDLDAKKLQGPGCMLTTAPGAHSLTRLHLLAPTGIMRQPSKLGHTCHRTTWYLAHITAQQASRSAPPTVPIPSSAAVCCCICRGSC
jgi:hypothetical protein